MDPDILKLLTETLPGSVVAGIALIIALRGRNGKSRHTVETTVQSILEARQQLQDTTTFRDMVAHELRVVAPERHRELMQAFDDVMTRLDGLERRDRSA